LLRSLAVVLAHGHAAVVAYPHGKAAGIPFLRGLSCGLKAREAPHYRRLSPLLHHMGKFVEKQSASGRRVRCVPVSAKHHIGTDRIGLRADRVR
jgi:hypothetical protein